MSIAQLTGRFLFVMPEKADGKMDIRKLDGHTWALDSMRGLAVLLVFMSHTSGRGMFIASWLNFHGLGHIGVYLFFVLSGFLLTKRLLRGQRGSQYFIRRFFRIVPLYFLILTCVVGYQAIGYYNPRYLYITDGWQGILLHYLFIKGDGIFWTLAAEFGFYLLLPLLVLLISKFGQKWLAAAAMVYFLWFFLIQILELPLTPLKFVIISHNSQFLDVFVCGILGAYIHDDLPKKLVGMLFWGLLIATLFGVSKNFLGAEQPWYDLRWFSIVYGVVFALSVVSVTQGNKIIIAPLRCKILVFIGVTGFGWYLVHFPVLQVVNFYLKDAPGALRLLASAGVTSIVSYILFRIIERPGIYWGRMIESYFFGKNIEDCFSSTPVAK